MAKEFQPIGERFGFQSQRFLVSFGNPAAGAALDALPADAQVQAWLAKASEVATQLGTQIAAEVVY